MVISVIFIIIGFTLLIVGADMLVDGSSGIAKKFHIPEIIIGLTIVSIGTSLPELFVSTTSVIDGHSDMAIGNVIGSNLTNLLLILGLSTIIKPVIFQKETRLYEIPMCLIFTVIFMILCNTNAEITQKEAVVLIIMFIIFIGYTIIMGRKEQKEEMLEIKTEGNKKRESIVRNILFIILGIIGLKIGGDLAVNNAVDIAKNFNISEKIISATILAIGTSLPELVTSVTAAIKGDSDIAIGNIIGSNIFNLFLIIGVASAINPIGYNLSYNTDLLILIAVTIVLAIFPFIPPKNEVSRANGAIYVLMYVGYICSLIMI